MKSETELSGFRTRLEQLIGSEQPFAWAKRIGIPSATFDRMWNAGTIPKAEHLLQISRSAGVTLEWLLTGNETIPSGSVDTSAAQTEHVQRVVMDEELHGRVVDGISRVYAEEGWKLPPIDLGRIAARTYADLVNACGDPDEQRVGLKLALEQLRRRLRAPIEPDQRKEQA